MSVFWPAPDRVVQVPLPKAHPEGILDYLERWAYDEETISVIIQTTHRQFRYVDPMDLLTFCKKDIARLVSKKLEVPPGLDELHTKEWVSQIATMHP